MPPKYEIRIRDVAGKKLEVRCILCNYTAYIEYEVLSERFDPNERIVKIDKHFRCSACGNRECNTWRVV